MDVEYDGISLSTQLQVAATNCYCFEEVSKQPISIVNNCSVNIQKKQVGKYVYVSIIIDVIRDQGWLID